MATTNIAFTTTWTKIVNAGSDFLLTVTLGPIDRVEVGVFSSTPGAGVRGHLLNASLGNGINRSLIGPGDVYARTLHTNATIIGALTAWTP